MTSAGHQIFTSHRIILMTGVLLSAFLGVVAGSYFALRKFGDGYRSKPGEKLSFKVGQVFPGYSFVDLNGKQTELDEEIDGKKGILIFLTTGCPHCDKEVRKLSPAYPKIDSKYFIIGISYETLDRLREYKLKEGISFPLLNDKNGRFTAKYGVDGFPIIVGINEEKRITFVQIGSKAAKSVEDYFEML